MNDVMNVHLSRMLRSVFSNLAPLLDDPDVGEIMVNGEDKVWIERGGMLERVPVSFSSKEAGNAIQILAALSDREVGPRHGVLLDTSFGNMRVSAVLFPIATQGNALCIRKHAGMRHTVHDYLPCPSHFSPATEAEPQTGAAINWLHPVQAVLAGWISNRKNVLVSGGTSTGKTTFLNALIQMFPHSERLVVIEDTRELTIASPNFVSFEAHPEHQVTIRDLVKQTLRFRPDRIIVGEVRGGEAFDLLQAMNTGHAGCLGTLHANSAVDALHRLEQMVLQSGVEWPVSAIAQQISNCIDGVIHLGRVSGTRQIVDLIQVEGRHNGDYQTRSLFQAS